MSKKQLFFLSFYPVKIVAWVSVFVVTSWAMTFYELSYQTHLFNEGVIGYSILAVIALSCYMFGRELFHFARDLKSLRYSESNSIQPVTHMAGEVGACV